MSFDARYSRRKFLGQTLRSAAGLVFISNLPVRTKQTHLERSFFTMGTVVTISVYGESRQHINHAIDKAIEEIHRIDRLMSLYKTDSQLVCVNSAAGKEAVRVDGELISVIKAAEKFHRLTAGAFDITVEPLMRLWGFRHEPPSLHKVPSDAEIQQKLDAVGFSHVVIDETNGTIGLKSAASRIDLGGIAVGFSVDLAVKALRSEGIEAAFINHSGDAYALGEPEDRCGWEVGIPDPRNPGKLTASLTLSNKAISTSGNYEKFVQIADHRYGHILDVVQGTPSDAVLSATVIAPSATEADALSTGIFCMDLQKAGRIVSKSEDVRAFVVSSEGRTAFLNGRSS